MSGETLLGQFSSRIDIQICQIVDPRRPGNTMIVVKLQHHAPRPTLHPNFSFVINRKSHTGLAKESNIDIKPKTESSLV